MSAVFDLAKSLSRVQMSEEEMALFSAAVLLSPGEVIYLELNGFIGLYSSLRKVNICLAALLEVAAPV